MENLNIFKKCPGCGIELTAQDIINDPHIIPIGMTFMDDCAEKAFIYFQHQLPECQSSFLIRASDFEPFIDEPVDNANKAQTENCSLSCTSLEEFSTCTARCYFGRLRRFIAKMIITKRGNKQQALSAKSEIIPDKLDPL